MAAAVNPEKLKAIADRLGKALNVSADEEAVGKLIDAAAAREEKKAMTTTPHRDVRFPNVNQASSCWTALNEYQYCVKAAGWKSPPCLQRRRDFVDMCPGTWLEEYKEQMEENRFAGIGNVMDPPADEEGEDSESEE